MCVCVCVGGGGGGVKFREISLSMVVILPLTCSRLLHPKFSDLKQGILDQVRQNGYQTVPFSEYTHNLMCFICYLSFLHD